MFVVFLYCLTDLNMSDSAGIALFIFCSLVFLFPNGFIPGSTGIVPVYTGLIPAYTGLYRIVPVYTGFIPAYTGLYRIHTRLKISNRTRTSIIPGPYQNHTEHKIANRNHTGIIPAVPRFYSGTNPV